MNSALGVRGRVLLLIKGLGRGGAERLLVDVVANRDRSEFDYEVAYVLKAQDALAQEMRDTGVTVHALGAKGSNDPRWTLALRRLLLRHRFDILHSHLPYTAAIGRLVARSLPASRRPALVYTEHSLWDRAAVLTKALNRSTIHLDQALLVVSPAARQALPDVLRDRAQVVIHGVDRARSEALLEDREATRKEVRAELHVPGEELIALTVANLRAEKGHDVLLEAARLSLAEHVGIRFVCVGSGPLEASLTAATARAGLAEHVVFLGRRPDTLRLMAGADVFVLPSHQEGMPVALMEAMSLGLPVVATTVGGVPDIVADDVEGLLVPPARPDLMAEALARITTDACLRSRLAGAALRRSSEFDVAKATRSIEDTYRELLSRRTR